MRFSTVIPSVLLVAFLAITHVVADSQVKNNVALTSDNVEAEIMYQYFEKREGAEDNTKNGTTIYNLRKPETTTETTTETTASTGSSYHGGGDATTGTSDKAATKAKAAGSFATIPIFLKGDLFYLGIAVTLFLWGTGKVLDVKMERQEKYAESQIHSI
ncbi:uncharacterized protein EV154DRAFT_558262 [Mucor mucedo]|uniref:uncharacterized protein n=1 Tax=Mucor mucedo TaxID=29922 RepID=UPI00221F678A|nr:uncharacterized protein EV154DRAFT_558262 [Mucor mucedo]KAI7896649.1 hypothetical protein EV154DRAFT_558262 [Mucor mucedo]